MSDLIWCDATRQAEAIRTREISAVELLREYLDRIDKFDGVLNTYVTVDREGALAAAAETDARLQANPESCPQFAGIPLSVKDTDDVAGMPTTISCSLLTDRIATEDSPVVARLRRAGAIMLGKTNVPEFCSSITNSRLNGICRNPWDTSRTVGGSSGGAAGALAAGLCAMSHGNDGGGSIRCPSSWCGLVGMKLSQGVISFGPEIDHPSFSMVSQGVLTRSVRDTAAMLDHLAPPEPWTPSRPLPFSEEVLLAPGRLRIGVCTNYPMGEVDPEVAAAVEAAGRLADQLGHAVETVQPDWDAILSVPPLTVPSLVAKHVDLADVDAIEPRNQAALRREYELTVIDHYRIIESIRAARIRFFGLWKQIDILLVPTVGIVAPPVEWAPWDQTPEEHSARFRNFSNVTQAFNTSGQPAISLPLAWSQAGMPIGVQLVGRPLEDGLVLRLAAQFEQASPWLDRISQAGRGLQATQ